MIYRTSQRGTYRSINTNLDLLSYRIAQLSNKIASEKSVNKPSDNPSGAATILRSRTIIAEINQNTANVNYANTWLTNTGNVLNSVKLALDEIYTKAEQGATDTYNAEQKKIIAAEIDVLFQTLIQFGDSKSGDDYLFSGQEVNTQPFSLNLRAQSLVAGCENSSLWTGTAKTATTDYKSRPDLPIQSQKYLVEVVQAGGIDSLKYAEQTGLSTLKILGQNDYGEYALNLTAQSPASNDAKIKVVTGEANVWSTGSAAADNLITYNAAGTNQPVTVVYQYASSSVAPTTAVFDQANQTINVYLSVNGDPPYNSSAASLATASDVTSALNLLSAATGVVAQTTGSGIVELAKDQSVNPAPLKTTISFNHSIDVRVSNGREITVYLPINDQGEISASVSAVAAAINNDPEASQLVVATASVVTNPSPYYPVSTAGPMSLATNFQSLIPSDPYTLAFAQTEIAGTHNDLVFSVKNEPGAPIGSAGNAISIVYEYSQNPLTTSETTASYDASAQTITVTLGHDGPVYLLEYTRQYSDPKSAAFKDAKEADRLARLSARTATALDVASAVNSLSKSLDPSLNPHVQATVADGDSGLGRVLPTLPLNLSQGYSQAALFRVSQDGGLTWGPPQAFSPSQFTTGQTFYNSQLGHASLTTNLAGAANDLVFTANYSGTWGDDVRIEFREPTPGTTNSPLSVTVGPALWNICVNLATDSAGTVITTANDVLKAINDHPEASQLVTVGLANYHEGGEGIVRALDCTALKTSPPYEVEGRTQITPLGHATALVAFDYKPPDQSSPDLIYQALAHGQAGNSVGIRYTTSADPNLYASGTLYQDRVSVSYEYLANGDQVAVVHLATEELPSCPDPDTDRLAYNEWLKLYPVYSCESGRAVVSTAGDVLEALVAKNLAAPASALVWASMDYKDEGWDTTAKVGPTNGTIWLSGGDDSLKAEDYGISLSFNPDGTAMQVGDRFEVAVGWYNGDQKALEVHAMNDYRTQINVTGDQVLGGNGDSDNVLDTVQRLYWGLQHGDTEMVERELPHLKAAIEKLTTMETNVGTRIIRNQFVLGNLEEDLYATETTLSQIEDADFTRLITDLKNAQLVYEAVLGSTGLTTKLSLLNYI
ncbi:MAG: hypothetical protein LBI10_04060 [Deltaproteobacteria bacterium]|jgi:flagellin-like hook-associated protein FlgL|nr:hypothetical protein [Deltaproteobacteria bacterium]